MKIDVVVNGWLEANCYILTNKNNESIIIDPGEEPDKVITACKDKKVIGIMATHHHKDHVSAMPMLEKHFSIKENNIISGFNYEIIKTPGHSSDSVTYYFPKDKIMFTGDFLFKDTIGRMDLPTGSISEMKDSLDLISTYPDNTIIYPGHGDFSSLKEEKKRFDSYGL